MSRLYFCNAPVVNILARGARKNKNISVKPEGTVAQHKAAKKSVRQDAKARMNNRGWKSKIKTARKKLEKSVESGETKVLDPLFKEYVSVVDRAVAKGVIHRNTASRKKTRMAQRMRGVPASAPAPAAKEAAEDTEETSTS
jgi:small subunit ribosomal protein S20